MHRTSTHGHATPALPHSAVHARRAARAWAASASALLVGGLVVAPPAQAAQAEQAAQTTQTAQAAQATQTTQATQAAEEPGGASLTLN